MKISKVMVEVEPELYERFKRVLASEGRKINFAIVELIRKYTEVKENEQRTEK